MVDGRRLAMWIAIGIGVGAAMGAAMDDMGVWVALGVAGGAAVGAVLSRKKPSSSLSLLAMTSCGASDTARAAMLMRRLSSMERRWIRNSS